MLSKNEARSNGKKKVIKPLEKKRSNTTLQITKVKSDRFVDKSKLVSSTCSRLPVCSKPRKPHNCVDPSTPATLKKPPALLRRKSISLVELNSHSPKVWTPKKWESKENLDEEKLKDILNASHEVSSLNGNEIDVANKVCKMFILNAWRHRRSQVLSLEEKVAKTTKEVDNLNIQIVVLRNLLDSEKVRVAVSMGDAAHLKVRLENQLNENYLLKDDKANLESQRDDWKKEKEDLTSEIQNLRDELTLTSEQNKYLRRECDDFEKSLSESQGRESHLQKQLMEVTNRLIEDDVILKETKTQVTSLLIRLSELKKVNQNLLKENENKKRKINECVNKINDMSVELNNSQNICKVQNENIIDLKRDLESLEDTVRTQNLDIENLKNTVQKYETEKEEFQNNLRKTRNRVIFEAIKISANLLFPYHPYL